MEDPSESQELQSVVLILEQLRKKKQDLERNIEDAQNRRLEEEERKRVQSERLSNICSQLEELQRKECAAKARLERAQVLQKGIHQKLETTRSRIKHYEEASKSEKSRLKDIIDKKESDVEIMLAALNNTIDELPSKETLASKLQDMDDEIKSVNEAREHIVCQQKAIQEEINSMRDTNGWRALHGQINGVINDVQDDMTRIEKRLEKENEKLKNLGTAQTKSLLRK